MGTAKDCDVTLSGANIEAKHARIFPRSGRVFCRALRGDPEDFKAKTHTWILPDTELRPGVDYMLAPGTQLTFGAMEAEPVTVQFEETADAAAQVMMDLMASAASPDVREELQRRQQGSEQ